MKLNRNTIVRYLKQGAKLFNWCDYDVDKSRKDTYKKTKERSSIPIIQLSLNNEFMREWNSITDITKELNISIKTISNCCKYKKKSSKGYRWLYKLDYENNIYNLNKYFENCKYNNLNGAKNVVQLDLNYYYIDEFESLKEAEKNIGISSSSISACCKNKTNRAGKFKWMYKEDYEKYIEDKNNIA